MESTRQWRFVPIRYRLIHLLYAMALIASAGATFGPVGLVVGLVIVTLWVVVFMFEPVGCGLQVVLFGPCMLMFIAMFIPCLERERAARDSGK